jgi:Protein of unknown function (DUF1475)
MIVIDARVRSMNTRRLLQIWFGLVLIAMLAVTGWATVVQPVWQWTGLIDKPNHAWTIATLFDAYFGFAAFYIWVLYKERRAVPRLLWFIAIMALGNMAMAVYVLKETRYLDDDDDLSRLLVRRNG